MAEHIDLGKKGELLAMDVLVQKGYEILDNNWRYEKAEVDIIAKAKNTIVFIEVKTRATDQFGNPEEAVSLKKQEKLALAAEKYIENMDEDIEVRFDIIAIIWNGNQSSINHIEDAFFPGM